MGPSGWPPLTGWNRDMGLSATLQIMGLGFSMYRVLTCLGFEHDWRLVALAGFVCFLASLAAVTLFDRARATTGRARLVWVGLDAFVSGCGIWATHFIAMLAYDGGAGAGYSTRVTILSLVFAVVITGI